MLCKDIIRHIGEKLDYRSLFYLSQVNKKFQKAIDSSFWQRLLQKKFNYFFDEKLDLLGNLKYYYPLLDDITKNTIRCKRKNDDKSNRKCCSFDIIKNEKFLGLIKFIIDNRPDYVPVEYVLHFCVEIEHEELINYVAKKCSNTPFNYALYNTMIKKY
jgi:hypothetical protein